MRILILALAFLALPTLAMAQQAEAPADLSTPQVELQQTMPASSPAAVDVVETERTDLDQADVQSQTMADEAAAQPAPTQPQWWWLVGAIVLAGIILAVIL